MDSFIFLSHMTRPKIEQVSPRLEAGVNRQSYGMDRFYSIVQTPENRINICDLFNGVVSISEYIGSIADDQ
jgi:hypothetical protein